jgi:two-component system alkaline phosphatase synthesis response regulator PhoP
MRLERVTPAPGHGYIGAMEPKGAGGRILVIEDDRDLAELLCFHLQDIGFAADWASDGEAGLKQARAGKYDLVILDLMLPRLDGLEVCRRLRQGSPGAPILILTAKSEEMDKVRGLELGADDYVTKPFSIRELQARVKAVLRRSQAGGSETRRGEGQPIRLGGLTVDPVKRKVALGDKVLELTAREFDLLTLLMRNPGRAYGRSELLSLVWGYQYEGYEHTLSSHVNRLRTKIEPDPDHPVYLKTVWGVGYRFAEPEELSR